MCPRVCSVSKTEPRITSYSNFTKIETSELTSKNVISNGQCVEILRRPLRSWHRNVSIGNLIYWFRVPVNPARKTRQQLNWQFTNCLEKHDLEQTTLNIDILYIFENHFLPWLTMWDSYLKIRPRLVWLHCQNFDSLSRKACFKLRSPFVTNGSHNHDCGVKGTCWRLGMPPTVAGDSHFCRSRGYFYTAPSWPKPTFSWRASFYPPCRRHLNVTRQQLQRLVCRSREITVNRAYAVERER